MSTSYLQLRRIGYTGPTKQAEHLFIKGVNVVCGASDTGKSFLAESIDFMLGGADLRDIPERNPYGEIQLDFGVNHDEEWRFFRGTSGGDFRALELNGNGAAESLLRRRHAHGRTDNVSGFLLEKIGLDKKRILRSKTKGTTQSLSFRNLARLVIVQEGEIQQTGSPFWGGQYTQKTAEMATVKLLRKRPANGAIDVRRGRVLGVSLGPGWRGRAGWAARLRPRRAIAPWAAR